MHGYPLYLKVNGVPCLVFGGGEVAARKAGTLLRRGARVTCVSREFSESLKKLAKKNRSLMLKKMSRGTGIKGDSPPKGGLSPFINIFIHNGTRLVIAATSDRDFNARVAALCRRKKILVNVADDPELCDFYAPAIVERGPLQIAISTDGRSPYFSRRLKEELEKVIPDSVGRVLERIGRIREKRRHLSGRGGRR